MGVIDTSDLVSIRLNKDIVLLVYQGGGHVHCAVLLIVPESSKGFVLYQFVYHEPFKVKMFRWELEGQKLEAEEEAFFEEVERLHKGEEWRKI